MTERHIHGAPDGIIEVLSPRKARHDYLTKRDLYPHAGVREYWGVNPVDRIVTVYTFLEGKFGKAGIADMAGERSPNIIPNIVIRWQPILDK